jgi:hypothetical protein
MLFIIRFIIIKVANKVLLLLVKRYIQGISSKGLIALTYIIIIIINLVIL